MSDFWSAIQKSVLRWRNGKRLHWLIRLSRVKLSQFGSGVRIFSGKESFAVVPGIRQVREGRLRGALGQLSHDKLVVLDECLDAYLR